MVTLHEIHNIIDVQISHDAQTIYILDNKGNIYKTVENTLRSLTDFKIGEVGGGERLCVGWDHLFILGN